MLTKLISQIISQQEENGKKQVYIPKGEGTSYVPFTWYGHITDDVGFKASFPRGAWGNIVISLVLEADKTYNFNCSCEGTSIEAIEVECTDRQEYYDVSFSFIPWKTETVLIKPNLSYTNDPIQFNVEIDKLPLNEFVLPEGSRHSR